jgi:hypothetical protein
MRDVIMGAFATRGDIDDPPPKEVEDFGMCRRLTGVPSIGYSL